MQVSICGRKTSACRKAKVTYRFAKVTPQWHDLHDEYGFARKEFTFTPARSSQGSSIENARGCNSATWTFLRRIRRMRAIVIIPYTRIFLGVSPVRTLDDKLPVPRLRIAKTQISVRMMNSRGCPINFIRTFNYADALSSFCCHIAAVSRR